MSRKILFLPFLICLLFFYKPCAAQTAAGIFNFGTDYFDGPSYVSTDDQGNFYILSSGNGAKLRIGDSTINLFQMNTDYAYIIKLDKDKQLLWYRTFGAGGQMKMALDDSSNIYITGSFNNFQYDTISWGYGPVTFRLDAQGNTNWAINKGGWRIRYDSNGYIEIFNFGKVNDTLGQQVTTNPRGVVARYDLNGNFINHFQIDEPNYSYEFVRGKDKNGLYYGFREDISISGSIAKLELFKADSSGNIIYSKILNYHYSLSNLQDMEYDPVKDEYFVAGYLFNREPLNASNGQKDNQMMLVRLDKNFNVLNTLDLSSVFYSTISNNTIENLINIEVIHNDVYVHFRSQFISYRPHISSFGQSNYVFPVEYETVIAKLSRDLRLKWYRNLPSIYMRITNPFISNNKLYYGGSNRSFTFDSVNFISPNFAADGFIMEMEDNDSVNIYINGTVFHDKDQNGSLGSNEDKLPYHKVVHSIHSGINYTDNNGNYNITGELGNQYLYTSPLKYWKMSTADSIQLNIQTLDTTFFDMDFGMYPVPGIVDLKVELTASTPVRPGFIAAYVVDICNVGTDTIDAQVMLEQDSMFIFQTIDHAVDSLVNNKIYLTTGAINPGDCIKVTITNLVHPVTSIGTFTHVKAIVDPAGNDTFPSDNIDEMNLLVTGSYDPNDISVSPHCDITGSFMDAGKSLEYLIRFQNTGNDTAFNVTITDTLSPHLDLSTFEFVSSSHFLDIKMNGNVLNLQYNNILLPDSTTNKSESTGYFKYKIKPSASMAVGDVISNTAHIFFDYNAPIQTNTVSTALINSTTTTINVNACYSYTAPSGTHEWDTSDTYYDTLADISGCDSVIIVNLTVVDLDTTITVDNNKLIANEQADAYQWMFCDSTIIAGATGKQFTPAANGNYAVVLSKNGCTDTSACITFTSVNIDEKEPHKIRIYPNPTAEAIIIEMGALHKELTVVVRNITGQVVQQQQYEQTEQIKITITTASGTYFIEVQDEDGVRSFYKILKM